jgi:hypothetical protein
MHIMFFTERAYHGNPEVLENEIFKRRSFFGVPNKFFDAQKGRSASQRVHRREDLL